ncbi:hypothetical protein [Nostoc sp.]
MYLETSQSFTPNTNPHRYTLTPPLRAIASTTKIAINQNPY